MGVIRFLRDLEPGVLGLVFDSNGVLVGEGVVAKRVRITDKSSSSESETTMVKVIDWPSTDCNMRNANNYTRLLTRLRAVVFAMLSVWLRFQ